MSLDTLVNAEIFHNSLVALKELDGVPALTLGGQIVNRRLLNVSENVLYSAREGVVRHYRAALCRLDSRLCRLLDARLAKCRDLNDSASENAGESCNVDIVAALTHDVHHIDSDHHGDTELDELGGEVKVSLKICAVDDVKYGVGALVYEESSRHDLLKSIGRERIYAGQVNDDHVGAVEESALLLLYRNAGPVADELIRARQSVKQRSLAGVGVACKCDLYSHIILSFLSFNLNICGVCLTECELIAADGELKRIAERCGLTNLYRHALGDAHIHYAASYSALAVNLHDHSAVSYIYVLQRSHVFTSVFELASANCIYDTPKSSICQGSFVIFCLSFINFGILPRRSS